MAKAPYSRGDGTFSFPLKNALQNIFIAAANGFSGSATMPPNATITISTTVSGLLKGTEGAVTAAVGDVDYQNPISLTTNYTTAPATLAHDTLNIPSAFSSAQVTVNGSSSGTVVFSELIQSTSYKKVIAFCNALSGTASYSFPTPFTKTPVVLSTAGLASTLVTSLFTTGATVTGSGSTGVLFIEGY